MAAIVIYLVMCVQFTANKVDLCEVGGHYCVLKQRNFLINCFGNYFYDKTVDCRLHIFVYMVTSTDFFFGWGIFTFHCNSYRLNEEIDPSIRTQISSLM